MHIFYDRFSGNNFLDIVLLASIASLILLIACINFINLTTAYSGQRSKEIGVRKVLGADKKHIIRQFLLESTLLSVTALLIALLLIELFFPVYKTIVGKEIALAGVFDINLLLILVGIILLTGFIAGSFPALYISSFQPVKTIKGIFETR